MTKAEVANKLGFSFRKIDNDVELCLKKKKIKNQAFWEESDIIEYEERMKQEKKKKEEAPVVVTKVDAISPTLFVFFSKWVRNMSGTLIYRISKDVNEWRHPKDPNIFNELSILKFNNTKSVYQHLEDVYHAELQKGEKFLLSKEEMSGNKLPPLSHKIDAFKRFVANDIRFFTTEISAFTNDKDEMTFKFFDISEKMKSGEHKHWDIWEKQLLPDDVKVFRAYVYSIYYAKDKNRQLLWLYDLGNRGKTKVMNALSRFGGIHFASACKPSSLKDKHYGTYFYGYRLILFDDNTNPFLVSDSILKSITGGGIISVDIKGVSSKIDYSPSVKVIISSNMKPIIEYQDSDISRLILIDVQLPSKEDAEYMQSVYDLEGVLVDELPFYLNACKQAYMEMCPNRNLIKLSDRQMSSIEQCQNSEDTIIGSFFNTYFEIYEKGAVMKTELDMCKGDYEHNQGVKMDYKNILKYLRGHNVTVKEKDVEGILAQQYRGMALRGWKFDEGRLERW